MSVNAPFFFLTKGITVYGGMLSNNMCGLFSNELTQSRPLCLQSC